MSGGCNCELLLAHHSESDNREISLHYAYP